MTILNKIIIMDYYVIPAALIVAFLIVLLFSIFSKRPMSGLWIILLIIFLAAWSSQLWITPFGPVLLGIAWVPLFVVSLFFAFLIFAIIPPISAPTTDASKGEEGAAITLGLFFWIMLILLITSIFVGYYRVIRL